MYNLHKEKKNIWLGVTHAYATRLASTVLVGARQVQMGARQVRATYSFQTS